MSLATIALPRPEVLSFRRRALAVLAAVLLLAAATVLANRVLPGWAYPVCGTVTAVALLTLARLSGLRWAEIGLDRRHARRALRFGLGGFAVVLIAFGAAIAIPPLRVLFHDGRIGSPGFGQLLLLALVRIPLGTVLLEEIAFRGVLPALLGAGERWRWWPVLGASALFGLWHLLPSLALTENAAVGATFGGFPLPVVSLLAMLAAAGAGVFLCWWRYTGRGLLAPMLVHLATNSGGLMLAWALVAQPH
ncbi:CPBP family intramembrane glutamic endopeptidase [Amycolatopsis pithecellobii]|uniref:CPBP family intramembrane metalloprotease n=1 Tax=Amycolatopsis pithecellobii TaxID=664692 RepID=A0A6N7YRR0_9PSEU|nr:CPBP family intramembrane glutamic endopeptidase [Amycolatopsis pithecellobii]MTD54608.1 CPBP family intramembrane metalloprotease [Amycolatopsis pithecellobii]